MRPEERTAVRRRFQYRCGYCGVGEPEVGAELTIDHFQPRSQGGLHEAKNWVYCCHACNEFKGNTWQPDCPRRILHPLHDNLAIHLVEQADGALQALSETGAFHIEKLRLNRAPLVAYRRERRLREDARRDRMRLIERLDQLAEQVRTLTAELERLDREGGV